MNAVRTVRKGFTLVEILIVVIILGILAAIVIPQFTSASEDARKNSLVSQVQTIRSQIELFKLQHTDNSNVFEGTTAADQWDFLLDVSNTDGDAWATGDGDKFGPYLQTTPVNGLNNNSLVFAGTGFDETTSTVVDSALTAGFAYNTDTGKFFALDKEGKIYLGN
jgi:general secretion pathway protein G